MEYHSNFNIMMLNNYFILEIPCQKKSENILKITLFFFEKVIQNYFNISGNNIISFEAAKVIQ
jgi:hypothetical protein